MVLAVPSELLFARACQQRITGNAFTVDVSDLARGLVCRCYSAVRRHGGLAKCWLAVVDRLLHDLTQSCSASQK